MPRKAAAKPRARKPRAKAVVLPIPVPVHTGSGLYQSGSGFLSNMLPGPLGGLARMVGLGRRRPRKQRGGNVWKDTGKDVGMYALSKLQNALGSL